MSETRLIVCGSAPRRKPWRPGWTDRSLLWAVLSSWELPKPGVVVQGGAEGADRFAREWAEAYGYRVETHEADWSLGRRAGPLRNETIADLGGEECLAFSTSWPPTRGTDSMCRLARERGIPVTVVTPDGVERSYTLSG